MTGTRRWTVLFNMWWGDKITHARTSFDDEAEAQEFYDWCKEKHLVPTKRPYFSGDDQGRCERGVIS